MSIRTGVLAYGSLVTDPGAELLPLVVEQRNAVTPFNVEFARISKTRGLAPTLVPVEDGGAPVPCVILVLDVAVSVQDAESMLWRRETRTTDVSRGYPGRQDGKKNAVVIERLEPFGGLDVVLYTRIAANAAHLTPLELAEHALASVHARPDERVADGVDYLIRVKAQGVITPKQPDYERAILTITGTERLDDALRKVQNEAHA